MSSSEFGLHINNDFQVMCDYIDGLLPQSKKEEVENHLSSCPTCLNEVESLRECENEFLSYSLNPDFLDEKREKIFQDLTLAQSGNKVKTFFSKPSKLSRFGVAGVTFTFVLIAVGAVNVFSPKHNNITEMIPSVNPNVSRSNIRPVSDEVDTQSFSEHIKAIEDLGYIVTQERGTYTITKQ